MSRRCVVTGILAFAAAVSAYGHPPVGIVVDRSGAVFTASGPMGGVHRIGPDGTVTRLLDEPQRRTLFNTHQLQWTTDGRGLLTAADAGGKIVRIEPRAGGTTAPVVIYPRSGEDALGDLGVGGDPFLVEPDGTILIGRSSFRRYAQIIAVAPDGRWSVRAGGAWGVADGPGAEARFESLHGASFARGPDGTVYFTDGGRRVRALGPDDRVRTLAGGTDDGFRDARGADAQFSGAYGVAVAPDGSLIVADAGNRRLRRVAPDGLVTTLAGDGERSNDDGPSGSASFFDPAGVAVAPDGTVYVRDQQDETHIAVRVVRDGRVTTLARIHEPFMALPAPSR